MRTITPSDAFRFFLLAGLGLTFHACGESATPGDGDGTGDGDAVIVPSHCTNPVPLVDSTDTGFFSCDEGFVHRAEQVACPSVLPRSETLPDPSTNSAPDECTQDADCEDPLSYCDVVESDGEPYLGCFQSCVTDADCESGYVCVCGEEFGTCAPGSANEGGCNTSEDCQEESLCAGVFYNPACGEGEYRFACTPTNLECEEDFCDWVCSTGPSGEIACSQNADCGRPFLVQSEIRLAGAVRRNDWASSHETAGQDEQVTDEEVLVAASYFERAARLEHASIAAFARFALQLLSLGAPAHLIEGTNRAMQDETKHACLAFALATRFSGSALGPGPLCIDDALADCSPESILTTTILEGCIGETKAALEARHALEACEDAEVRATLEQIADDEAVHAELAWKAVQWVLTSRPELRSSAQKAFENALAAPRRNSRAPGAPRLGVPCGQDIERVHTDALERVVRPCMQALFGALSSRPERQVRERPLQT